jgi:hypothetical protein
VYRSTLTPAALSQGDEDHAVEHEQTADQAADVKPVRRLRRRDLVLVAFAGRRPLFLVAGCAGDSERSIGG